MKIKIDRYEIEIKAKLCSDYEVRRMNARDTMAILNHISSWAYAAADNMDDLGCHNLAKSTRNAGRDIYEQLNAKGYYD